MSPSSAKTFLTACKNPRLQSDVPTCRCLEIMMRDRQYSVVKTLESIHSITDLRELGIVVSFLPSCKDVNGAWGDRYCFHETL